MPEPTSSVAIGGLFLGITLPSGEFGSGQVSPDFTTALARERWPYHSREVPAPKAFRHSLARAKIVAAT